MNAEIVSVEISSVLDYVRSEHPGDTALQQRLARIGRMVKPEDIRDLPERRPRVVQDVEDGI